MGISKRSFEYEQMVLKKCNMDYKNLMLLEIGEQTNRINHLSTNEFYRQLEVKRLSIDINGKNGALEIDLNKPLPNNLHNAFDIVTNYGTIEHVVNQWQAFKNMHDACKINGIMIHLLPLINNWKNHCAYHYDIKFVKNMMIKNDYRVIDHRILKKNNVKNLLACVFMKKHSTFIPESFFWNIEGIHFNGDMRKMGNYTEK